MLVPVFAWDASAETERRMQTAAALARENRGGVVVCYVATLPRQTPLDISPENNPILIDAKKKAAELVEFTMGIGVPTEGHVHLAHQELPSVLNATEIYEADGVVLTVRATSPSVSVYLRGSTVEKIIARGECDVFVEKQAANETPIQQISLAISGGPHSELATQTARALAVATGAYVDVVHFLDENATPAEKERGRKSLRQLNAPFQA